PGRDRGGLPVADAGALAHGHRQRVAAAGVGGRRGRRGARPRCRGAAPGGLGGRRAGAARAAFRRHGDARLAGARARHLAEGAAARRAVRGARRDHPPPARRRRTGAVGGRAPGDRLRHPQCRGGRLHGRPRGGDDGWARPHRGRARRRGAVPAPARLPHHRGLPPHRRAAVGDAAAGHGGAGVKRSVAILAPTLFVALLLAAWEIACRALNVPPYFLPTPSAIVLALVENAPLLFVSAWRTLSTSLMAFAITGVLAGLAALGAASARLAEASFRPIAIALQVTPIIAIAPLFTVWAGIDHPQVAVVALACVAAFFPMYSGALAGLSAVDPELERLFDLYGASGWQRLTRLK